MEVKYMEITARPAGITVSIYTPEQYENEQARRRDAEERTRRVNRLRENIGAVMVVAAFLLLMAAGGCYEIGAFAALATAGLALFALGAWLSHAFYGQEDNAEWARR